MQPRTAFKEAFLFFGLSLGLSYLVFWGPLALFQVPAISFVRNIRGPGWAIALFIAGGFVPSLVALALTAAREGKAGLRALGRRVIQLNLGWRWYLAVVGLVSLAVGGQVLVLRGLGQALDPRLFLVQLGGALPLLVTGPLSEELGWRGYALDRLQTGWNPLASSLVVGLAWGCWHLPLFFMVGTSQYELQMPFLGFLLGVTAQSVLYTWLHNHTGGSIWTAIFFHWLYTYAGQVVASAVIRSPAYNWLEHLPSILLALALVIVWKPYRRVGAPRQPRA